MAAAMPPPNPMPKPSFNRRFSSSNSLILLAAVESAVVVVAAAVDDDVVKLDVAIVVNGDGGATVMLIQQSHCIHTGIQVVVVLVVVAIRKRSESDLFSTVCLLFSTETPTALRSILAKIRPQPHPLRLS